jgi:hypothetical protein
MCLPPAFSLSEGNLWTFTGLVAAGGFVKFWKAGVEQFDELKGLDWSWLSLDGAMTKAPCGGEKNRPQSHGSRQVWRQA